MRAWFAILPLAAACTGLIDGPGQMPAAGAPQPSPTPSATPAPSAPPLGPRAGARLLRRLTGAEYDRAVQDSLQIVSDHGARFPADVVVEGFANHAAALSVTPLLSDQLLAAAEDLGRRATERDLCANSDAACLRRIARKMFRRPLEAHEWARYERLRSEHGMEAAFTALLMSPHFLYRAEIGAPAAGTRYPLTGYEIATQLSFAITGSTPDDALLDAAEAGALDTADGIAAEARRLFGTPRAREVSRAFVRAWLELDRLDHVPKAFAELTPAARASMGAAVDRFVERALHDEGTLEALLTSDTTFVDAELAALLGETPAGAALEPRIDPERRGIIAQPAFLTTHARPNASSPVHRGVIVRRRLLCQPLPPPPPGVNAEPPAIDPALTGRERYAAHSASPACQGCHRRVDDIGFGLERFDGIGRWRDREAGKPIDTAGVVEHIDGRDAPFDGAGELAALLGSSREVRDCFVGQRASYAWGLSAETELAADLAAVRAALPSGAPLSIEALTVALMTSPHVRERIGPASTSSATPPAPAPDPPSETPATPALHVEERLDSIWDTGSCTTVVVTNRGPSEVEWTARTRVDGALSQSWNATPSAQSGDIEWRGVAWNARIPAGSSASFGYCAAR